MNISIATKRFSRGLTLIETLLAIALIVIFGMIMFSTPRTSKARAVRIACVSNLRQIGLASRVWADDHSDKFPWDVAKTNGGMMEFTSGPNLWQHFQIMSNELTTPTVLFCVAEASWTPSTNFAFLNNSNISYFINLNAEKTNSQVLLSGDRNITNGTLIENGILKLTANHAAGWTDELHNRCGNILLADGSVLKVTRVSLQDAIAKGPVVTNRLLMPILTR